MPMTVLMQARTLACLLVCLSPGMVEAATGRTATDFGVSPSGEASYSIPIVAPPGTHGMTPRTALVYGHRNGSTLVGAGWSIAGLSSIYRCSSSWAADGVARDVRNDATDRFCLDGNKLRLTGGTYGQAGATYQTEIETFSRATSSGAAGNGPAYFIVETRDGLIYEYGNTADSRIESVGQATARAWAVNKIKDRSGNAIDFVYTEDATNGAYRIARIDYTSNSNRSLSAAYRIEFVWQTKPSNEIDSGYIAGGVVKHITRLDRIDVTYNTAIVRRYELTYESALSSTSKSRLLSIQECAGTELDCYEPTTFAYQNGVPGLGEEISTGTSVATTPWPLDVNGDGRSDLVYSSSDTSGTGTWQVMLANASGGYSPPQNTGVTNTNYGGAIPIDYNADGLEDLLVPYAAGTWWVMLGSASGLDSPIDTGAPATGTGSHARAFDVDGDGLDDLVWADLVGYAGGDAIRYRLREWGGAFSSAVYYLAGPYAPDWRIESGVFGSPGQRSRQRVPDVNGDGRGDLIFRYTTRQWIDGTSTWKYFRRIGVICPGGSGATVTNPNASGDPHYGDFNGDGKSDLLYLNQNGDYVARFSTGAGLTGEIAVAYMGSYGDLVILDWDSDGKDDVLLAGANGWSVVRATGEGFAAPANTGLSAGTNATVTDLNGDGLFEIAASVDGTWRYRLHAGALPDLLQSATDGYGNQVTFNYTPISQGSYTKGSGAVFPEMDYTGALSVVNSASASDGIGGTYTRSFGYAQARMHLQGRGFEGFFTRSSLDSRNGIQVTESRAQLFPYTGMTLESVVRQPTSNGSKEISRQTHTLQSHQYSYSGAHARILPYVSASTAMRREVGGIYDGALISTTTASNSVHPDTGLTYDTTVTTTEASTGIGVQPGASYVQRVQLPLAYLFNDTTNWCIGRPGRIESTNSHNQYGGAAITRTTAISWDSAALCRPAQTTSEPGDPALQVVRSLSYDDFGNVDAETVMAAGMADRTTQIGWGTTGQFPESMTDALGKTSTFEWYYSLGLKKQQIDPNGIATSWQYDDFGRQTRESRQGSTATHEHSMLNTERSCTTRSSKMDFLGHE